MKNSIEFEKGKNIAIRYIGISKKTIYEVTQKLKLKDISFDTINEIIMYLKQLNYLNDKEYINCFISQNIRFEKYSIFEIKQKLKLKGIDLKKYDEEFYILNDIEYEKNVIKKLKKFKLKNYDEIKIKKYLYNRGFKIRED